MYLFAFLGACAIICSLQTAEYKLHAAQFNTVRLAQLIGRLCILVPCVPLRVGSIPSLVLYFVLLLSIHVFNIPNVQSESNKYNHVVLQQEEG
jgi:hypothetical protein